MYRELNEHLVGPLDLSLKAVIDRINKSGLGIFLVVDECGHLVNTITDGDIRRAILSGIDLTSSISEVVDQKAAGLFKSPLTASAQDAAGHLQRLMRDHSIRHVPIVDPSGKLVDLAIDKDLDTPPAPALEAIIMAGGFGTRLRPYTDDLPKPMLPVGGKPLLEHIVVSLKNSGIRKFNITTHFLAEKIQEHFGDGSRFNVEIDYINEDKPLGTAGALTLMEKPKSRVLVINGDILTRVDFESMLHFHEESHAAVSVAVRHYEMQVPYGVVERSGDMVQRIVEKPSYDFFVNAGIYILEPEAFDYVPKGQFSAMTDLINRMVAEGKTVASFPIMEYWLDIGLHDDYMRAQLDMVGGAV